MDELFDNTNWFIEVPLSWPFFWRSEKICDFIRKTSDAKLTATISDQQNVERRLQSVQSNWKDVLSEFSCCPEPSEGDPELKNYDYGEQSSAFNTKRTTHFDIMTHRYHPDNRSNPTKVTATREKVTEEDLKNPMSLLRFIRNKYVHFADMPPMFERALGWTSDEVRADGKGNRDEAKFAKYWTSKFPRLLPFLWLQFYEVGREERSLLKFYPKVLKATKEFQLGRETLPTSLNDLMVNLMKALQYDLERGGVTGRFISVGSVIESGEDAWQCDLEKGGIRLHLRANEVVLEFRILEKTAVQGILDGRLIFKAELTCQSARCFWYNQYKVGSMAEDETSLNILEEHTCTNNTVIIVGNELDGIVKVLSEELKIGRAKQIIIYSEEGIALVKHLEEWQKSENIRSNPVEWKEIVSVSVRKAVINEKRLKIQNTDDVSLDALLPHCDDDRAHLLSYLEGNLLNQLLREKKTTLFEDLKIPQISDVYIPRQMCKIGAVSNDTLETAPSSELFVIFRASVKQIKKVFAQKEITVFNKTDFSYYSDPTFDSNILVTVEEEPGDFEQICSTEQMNNLGSRNIHFLRYVHNNLFEWIYTLGSNSILKNSFVDIYPNTAIIEEKDFLSSCRACWKDMKTVAIVDSPGNGKSTFLTRLAVQSSESFENHFTLFISMSELVEKVDSQNVSRESIVHVLSSMVGPANFERQLCKYWLECNDPDDNSGKKFELFVDALDEVRVDHRKKALAIFKLILDFSSVNICVALRDHFLADLQKCCWNTELYKLQTFSLETQISFLVEYWQGKMAEKVGGSELEKLTNFARECLDLRLPEEAAPIAGTPLICRVLAEIYETFALSGDYRHLFACSSLSILYDLMWNRKFDIWLEKLDLPQAITGKQMPAIDAIRAEMQNWHTYLAIKLLFGEKTANKFKSCFFTSQQSLKKMQFTVLQQAVVTSLDPLAFLQQTFAEDLVAQFVVAVFKGEFICLQVDSDEFECFLFHSVLAVLDPTQNCTRFKHPTLCYFLNARSQNEKNAILNNVYSLRGLHQRHLYRLRTSCTLSIYVAFLNNFKDLLALLANSPVYAIALFEISIRLGKTELCKGILEQLDTTIFNPSNLSRYCKLTFKNICSIEHWFFENIVDVLIREYEPLEVLKELVRVLVKKSQFDLERTDSQGKTPLLFLLNTYTLVDIAKLAQMLVADFGVNVGVVDDFGNTVFHATHQCTMVCVDECFYLNECTVQAYVELWKSLPAAGLSRHAVNAQNDDGETPLFTAVKIFRGCANGAVQFFKESGADFNARNRRSETVLNKAISMTDGALVDTLVGCGSDVDAFGKTYQGISSLIKMNGLVALEQLTSKVGNDSYDLNGDGGDPLLHQVIKRFDNKFITTLFDSKINMEVVDADGVSALHLAAMKNVELLEFCVERFKMDVNAKDSQGKTLLHKNCNSKIIPKMREYGADFNAQDADGETVLEKAIRIGDEALVDGLVKAGADILRLGKSYEHVFSLALIDCVTVLAAYIYLFRLNFHFKADAESRLELMKLCVEKHGVNVNAKDKEGKTYLHKAIKKGNEQFIKKLVELGANINEPDSNGESAVHLAAIEHPALLHLFVEEFKADLNDIGPCGSSAFHHAIHSRCEDSHSIRRLIRECHVDIDVVNSKGQDAFHLAALADNGWCFYSLQKKFDIKFDLTDANGKTFTDYLVNVRPRNVLQFFTGYRERKQLLP